LQLVMLTGFVTEWLCHSLNTYSFLWIKSCL